MEYTINKLATLAGVSTRTLRYYDQTGLLTPAYINCSGYRIYGTEQINRLQQILFYKTCGLELSEIGAILDNPCFDEKKAMEQHLSRLLRQRQELDTLIANAQATLETIKGETTMNDTQKFEGFKKQLVDENEKTYGKEIREKYGDGAVEFSNQKTLNLSEEQYAAFTALSNQVNETLAKAVENGSPTSALGQETAKLHKEWLGFTWKNYTPEAHMGLAEMYVDDERFTVYYEKIALGATVFLRDAIVAFCTK